MVCCREIGADDIDNVVDLLARGFVTGPNYWSQALQRLTDHPTPPGFPKYGYALDDEGELVGVVLLIFTSVRVNGENRTRCNVSSWYVEPRYRSYGSILAMRAVRHKGATYFNISPAPHTWPILERQGFSQFAAGRTVAVPALSRSSSGVRVQEVMPGVCPALDLAQSEIDVLMHHKSYGCLSLICEVDGVRHPFVFGLDRRRRLLWFADLVYCRNIGEFTRFAGPIGRSARRGYVLVRFDLNGPTSGIVSQYRGGRPKYRKGDGIDLGDVAYSEQVMFGWWNGQ